jgi:hypothetical protein
MSTLKVNFIESYTLAQPVTISDSLIATGSITVNISELPTSNPGIRGRLYRTGSNFDELKISL